MTTNEIFAKMLDWIFTNTDSTKNVDVARKAGLNETSVSRILNNRVKTTKQETLRAVNAAYGNVFNPEWLRGKSDVMLVADLTTTGGQENGAGMQQSAAPDMSSVNAIVAAKDETIAELHRQLADKDAALKRELADKERYIAHLEEELAALKSEKGLPASYTFTGVADKAGKRQ